MRFVVRRFEKMHVVGGDERQAEFARQFDESTIALALEFHAVVVQLHVKITFREDVPETRHGLTRFRGLVGHEMSH